MALLHQKLGFGLLFLAARSCLLSGQSTTGTIVGSVTDPSGAVIPAVQVTVTNLATNITAGATTDGHGDYVVTPLAIGTYSIAFEAKGFKKYVETA